MISLFRIDDRLLHGQVAFGWSPAVQANVILIVNDEAKNDKVKAMALDLAKPNNVKLYIRGVKESGEIVSKFAEAKKSNVVVLVRNTNDALEVIRNANGVVTELNVGGLRYEEGKQKLTDLIAVSDQDLDNFKKIENLGVNIDFRILPRDKKQLLGDLVKNRSK